ncbi:MAG: ABC transporter substrate-binding protein [Chloroflexota bacterium]|nr:ABC transporter substrate-binding protein [Chloroflexota bacterium]
MPTDDLRSLIEALAAGCLSRRRFVRRAVGLGLSVPLASVIASDPVAGLAAAPARQAPPPTGPAAERMTFSSFNVDQAALEIRNDAMDVYLFGLKNAGAQQVTEGGPGVRLIQAPASTLSLILNPAPAREGEINPFAIKEIRRAVQYLVDRDFIANTIYQGRAVPMRSHVSPLDYDQLTVFSALQTADLRYDPEFARGIVAEQMQAAGATLENNVWTFNGRPVALKIVTRVEDERREIGDAVRAALEGVGFQVQPVYQQFGPATLAVYASDPITFQWHVYTEGWGRSAPDRYDFGGINAYAAPWLGNMPGWLETGFWQYQQPELDRLGQQLYRGQFQTKEERDELYRQMTTLALDESVRVWLVTALQSFPAREELRDLNEDLVAGPKGIVSLREAHVDGAEEVRVGHLWVWTDQTTWNPVGGLSDVYSSDIYKNLVDPAILNHPFTGIPEPFRADFAVETAGPSGTLPVPGDALRWDAAADAWTPVGDGVTAVSKVTYDYSRFFRAPFHHGQPITSADLVYSIVQSYELAYDEERLQIEPALGITQRPFLETFKGFRLLEDDRFEVYVDYWHFEPNYIASYAQVGGLGTPWELLAAMDDIVFGQRRGAYSNTAAARFSVPWLSLVTEPDARAVVRALRGFVRDEFVPEGVFDLNGRVLVTPEQAVARYEAAAAWFDQTGLMVISNGPYQLVRYDPPAQFAELRAFRPEGYPFRPGDLRYGAPPRLAIQVQPPPPAVLGEPISVPVTVQGPGALGVQYALVDPAQGSIATSGAATGGEGGNFTVDLDPAVTSTLFPSIYQLYLLASSDAIAQVAEQRVDLEIAV